VSGNCSLRGSRTSISLNGPPKPRSFARRAAAHSARLSHYQIRLNQLNKFHSYRWLDATLPKTTARLLEQFGDPSLLTFEQNVKHKVEEETHRAAVEGGVTVQGQVDILEKSSKEGEPPTIWEVKFTSTLSAENVAQLVTYGYLWSAQRAEEGSQFPRLVLFNVQDGTKWKVITTFDNASAFVKEVLRLKDTPEVSDESFLARCKEIRDEVARVESGTATTELGR